MKTCPYSPARRGQHIPCYLAILISVCALGIASASESRFLLADEEVLQYLAEWRFIHAGDVVMQWKSPTAAPTDTGKFDLTIRSAGLVNALYSVNNHYTSRVDRSLCASESFLSANEGSKRRETRVIFDKVAREARYRERDLKTNMTVSEKSVAIPECVHEILGALYGLRSMEIPIGSSAEIPISDGKKSVTVRVEAQRRENLEIGKEKYSAIRYEAFLFRNVLYRRDASAYVWLTDDPQRIPVQIRVRMPFYIGTVTLQLQNREVK